MDEEGQGFKFKPEHIIYASAGVIIFEVLFRLGLI